MVRQERRGEAIRVGLGDVVIYVDFLWINFRRPEAVPLVPPRIAIHLLNQLIQFILVFDSDFGI